MRLGVFARTFEKNVFRSAREAGFASVQYNMACSDLPSLPDRVTDAVADAVARNAADAGIAIVAVSATYNMIHPDPEQRAAGRRAFAAIAEQAKRMGTSLVTLCTGSRDANDQWHHHPENASHEAWADLIAEFEAIIPLAEAAGVHLGIEPELGNVVSDAITARRLLDEMRSDRLRIVLDPANLFEVASPVHVRRLVEEAVHLLGPHIAMAHAKDRDAAGSFCAPGQGIIDFGNFTRRLRAAGFDGDLVTHGLSAAEAPAVAALLTELAKT